ncbi:hypothetical protein PUV54_05270 [Hyphococcus flavus]|uniref:Uncharacterized protein n=1 Tax=Hyphococcus flavus TaxID=1866326 RepID=A0AAE9ZCY6_9PROT|nr:hypothetical protein [Hyphococcus flavus]WDI32604.1 hypothetical protein PUV54_05270 [Hyphococcus flavus]
MKKATFFVMLFASGACVTPQVSGPIETSISEIQKNPRTWDGKVVRVTGTFDECISYTCEFCEREEHVSKPGDPGSHCMRVSFHSDQERMAPERFAQYAYGAHFSVEGAYETLARFTTSTIEAVYDASCTGTSLQDDIIVMCTDRASELEQARIIKTHFRRPTVGGVINAYGIDPLGIPDDETVSAISEAFQEQSSVFDEENILPDFVYTYRADSEMLDGAEIDAVGGACICLVEECADSDWPKREGDIWLDTPSNHYRCWYAELVDGVWRFPIQ